MSVAELSEYTAVSKYARYIEEEKRRETWNEAVSRNEEMMLDRFPNLSGEIRQSYDFVREKKVLGSMRAMQFGGLPALKHNGRMYNCTASYCDRLRFFQECFYLLLCGCGTGFSVQERHVACLPRLSPKRLAGVRLPRKVFRIPDCIEGWADAEGALLSSYHEEPVVGFEEWHDCDITFDPSPIRRRGAPLSCGIGRAPGPDPLMRALDQGRHLLDRACGLKMERLTPLYAYDFTMYFADASVAGGVRRSATICIFSLWDFDMATCKTGNWLKTNPQRARSNNSAAMLRHSTHWEEFAKLFKHTKQFGEPGVYWCDDYDIIPNPCVEVGFWPRLLVGRDDPILQKYQGPMIGTDGGSMDGSVERELDRRKEKVAVSGWQMCNLSTINGRTVEDEGDFYQRCEAAAAIGTFQAAFTDFPYLGPVTEAIVRKEALLGVAICGMMHKPALFLDPAVQRRGAQIVLDTNDRLAGPCGVNPCARGTCIKPDGKSSAVLMSEPGIHPGHSERYFRIVQANINERPYQYFRSVNPEACERSVWSSSDQDDCVRFCIEEPAGTVLKRDISAIEMLENVRLTYQNWIQAGKRPERCTHPGLCNNVSNTVTVRPDEWEGVAHYIYDNRDCLAGVSLAPDSCDRDYAQAPYTAVYTPEQQRQLYGNLAACNAPQLVNEALEAGFRDLWDACDLALGLWDLTKQYPTCQQTEWVRSLAEFTTRHFGGNITDPGFRSVLKKTTYCLKDCYNWHLWCILKANYREVDYSQMVEEQMTTDLQGEMACQGGACLLNI